LLHLRFALFICLVCPVLSGGQNLNSHSNQANYISFKVPGSTSTVPFSINDSGAVTGYYYSPTVHLGGFIRDAEGCITTFEFPGAGETEPISINASGEVTGYWTTANTYGPPWQGFVRNRWGVYTSINVPGSTSVWPVAINANGTVIGYYSTATDYQLPFYGFVRSPNGAITTFNPPGAVDTYFSDINDAGEIIGYSYDGVSDSYFVLRNGVMTSVGGFPESINQEGDVAGEYGQAQGFVQSRNGNFTPFTVPGAGWGTGYLTINDRGTVMGGYSDQLSSPVSHGFTRSRDGAITSFDPPRSGTTIPTSLNNSGVITGFYYIGTSTSAWGFLHFPEHDHL
jgi:hypothetical protein